MPDGIDKNIKEDPASRPGDPVKNESADESATDTAANEALGPVACSITCSVRESAKVSDHVMELGLYKSWERSER
jgi:hypothetical protein